MSIIQKDPLAHTWNPLQKSIVDSKVTHIDAGIFEFCNDFLVWVSSGGFVSLRFSFPRFPLRPNRAGDLPFGNDDILRSRPPVNGTTNPKSWYYV